MAQRQFPLEPIQTQLTRPSTNVTAPAVAGPQETGLSQGLASFSKAIGKAAEFAKARQFKEELKIAKLAAAREEVAPGLVSQAAIDLNYNLLDMNFATKVINQAKLWADHNGNNLANEIGKTGAQKATEIESVFDEIEARLGFITHNGEALNKAREALELNKLELYHDIAQFELRNTEQNGITWALGEIDQRITGWGERQEYIHKGKKYTQKKLTPSFTKSLIYTLEQLQTKHKFIDINGKKIKVISGFDERKGVFSILANSIIDNYEIDPELSLEFEEIINEIYQPLIIKENALITQGKADAIGDHTTFQSLLDKYYTDLKKKQDTLDTINKNASDKWESQFALALDPKQRAVTPEQYNTKILPHFGDNVEDANKVWTRMNKYLNTQKQGIDSQKFYTGLDYILTGGITDEQIIEQWGINNLLSNDAIKALKSDLTEKRLDIQQNKEFIEENIPELTWARIHKALGEGRVSEYITVKLKELNIPLNQAIKLPVLQSVVSAANHLTTTDEIIQPLKDTAKFVRDTRSATYKLSRKAAYRPDNRATPKIDETDITEEEITQFITDRTKAFQVLLDQFTLKKVPPKK